jgi:hypothetical protein
VNHRIATESTGSRREFATTKSMRNATRPRGGFSEAFLVKGTRSEAGKCADFLFSASIGVRDHAMPREVGNHGVWI